MWVCVESDGEFTYTQNEITLKTQMQKHPKFGNYRLYLSKDVANSDVTHHNVINR